MVLLSVVLIPQSMSANDSKVSHAAQIDIACVWSISDRSGSITILSVPAVLHGVEEAMSEVKCKNCNRCGHPASWHRHDDADSVPPTDPNCKFRCIGYDCEVEGPPPKHPCTCPNYVEAYDAD